MHWYALLTTPGRENKVRADVLQRLSGAGKSRHVREVVVPTTQVTTIEDGKKKTKDQRLLPGYVLVHAEIPFVYSLLKDTKGVRGFVGAGGEPTRMTAGEVQRILGRGSKGGADRAVNAPTFKAGETVRIVSGPLAEFSGEIAEVDERGTKLTVMVPIFGRPTPAEVEFSQVRKD